MGGSIIDDDEVDKLVREILMLTRSHPRGRCLVRIDDLNDGGKVARVISSFKIICGSGTTVVR